MLEIVDLLLENEHGLRGILNKYERTKNENELDMVTKSKWFLQNVNSTECMYTLLANGIYCDYNDPSCTQDSPQKQLENKYKEQIDSINNLLQNGAKTTQVKAIKLPYFRHYHSNELGTCNIPTIKYSNTIKEYIVDIITILQKLFDSIQVEMFVIIDLDELNNIKDVCCASIGTVDKIKITQSKITEYMLLHDSKRIVIAHNHPSNVANPSIEDASLTRNILRNCSKYDIEFCDHIIYGSDGSFSFKKSGLLDKIINSVQLTDK